MIIIKYEKCQEQKLNGGNDWNAVCLCLVETDVLVVPTHYQHIYCKTARLKLQHFSQPIMTALGTTYN